MLSRLHNRKSLQGILALVFGFCFGFFLQKGGVCYYEVIIRQLLLQDFTVVKVMLSAVATGMIGVYAMRQAGWVSLHKKSGSVGTNVPGPLIFGVGFGVLGYCPGTVVGAVGHGALDALLGAVVGITLGAGLYAAVYPALKGRILAVGDLGDRTLIDMAGVRNPWMVILPVFVLILRVLFGLEAAGL